MILAWRPQTDHKPVKCMLDVDIAYVDERVRTQEIAEIISTNTGVQCLIKELNFVPEFSVSTDHINLQNGDTSVIRVVNKNRRERVILDIFSSDTLTPSSEHQHKRGFFPKWLKVSSFSILCCITERKKNTANHLNIRISKHAKSKACYLK
jgi:hypothetical protein